jgi:hypothetical protein
VADALCRCDGDDLHIQTLSTPTFELYDEIRQAIIASPVLTALRNTIVAGLQDQHGLSRMT